MSLFSKLWKSVRKVAEPVLRTVAASNPITSAAVSMYDASRAMRPTIPGRSTSMSLLPAAAAIGRAAIPRAVAIGKRVLPGVAGSAAATAVMNRVTITGNRGAPRRRRAKGITGNELKAFKRVTKVLDTYCKVKPPTRSRTYGKGKSCR